MKNLVLFILSMIVSHSFHSQTVIPNGNFEIWDFYNTWTLEPEHWQTSNGQLIEHVFQDSNAYEGNLAMKVTPINLGLGEYGAAISNLNIEGENNDYLNFQVRSEIIGGAQVGVNLIYFLDTIEVYTQSWWSNSSINNWSPFQIDLSQFNGEADSASIVVFVSVGDLIDGEGWISVDDMYFSLMTDVPQLNEEPVIIYPIPNLGQLNLDFSQDWDNSEIELYNIEGRLVLKQKISTKIDLSSFPSGKYYLKVVNENNELFSKKIVVTNE